MMMMNKKKRGKHTHTHELADGKRVPLITRPFHDISRGGEIGICCALCYIAGFLKRKATLI
jgi:hypothetical protein